MKLFSRQSSKHEDLNSAFTQKMSFKNYDCVTQLTKVKNSMLVIHKVEIFIMSLIYFLVLRKEYRMGVETKFFCLAHQEYSPCSIFSYLTDQNNSPRKHLKKFFIVSTY